MTPSEAAANATANENQIWTPLINANRTHALINSGQAAVRQTAENYTEHYEAEIIKINARHQQELSRLTMSLSALQSVTENRFGKDVAEELMREQEEMVAAARIYDAKQRPPELDAHQLHNEDYDGGMADLVGPPHPKTGMSRRTKKIARIAIKTIIYPMMVAPILYLCVVIAWLVRNALFS